MHRSVLLQWPESRILPSRAIGVDVASFQHPSGASINWSSVYSSGVQFAYVKATQADTNYYNTYFAGDAAGATTR